MKTIAFFSPKGGIGRTSLTYHLGFMFAELGRRVLLADLDPQANLSAMCLAEDRLDTIWSAAQQSTIAGAIEPLRGGPGSLDTVALERVTARIDLLPGDPQLSELEDDLAQQWSKCLVGDARAFCVTTSLSQLVAAAGARCGAELTLLDVAPNFGAINRAALLAADHLIVPVAPDTLSMRGLENVGHQITAWREQWRERREHAPDLGFDLPAGALAPLGYVVVRHPALVGEHVATSEHRLEQLPATYRRVFALPEEPDVDFMDDPLCLSELRDYPSLMMMARQARRPMFLLKPADGALGAHLAAVRAVYNDYRVLVVAICERIGL
jgi:chromosome partitioning protein